MFFPSLRTTGACVAGLAMNGIVLCWPVNDFVRFHRYVCKAKKPTAISQAKHVKCLKMLVAY